MGQSSLTGDMQCISRWVKALHGQQWQKWEGPYALWGVLTPPPGAEWLQLTSCAG